MATAHPQPAPAKEAARVKVPAAAAVAPAAALVPVPRIPGEGDGAEFSAPVMSLPVELDIAVPVREFRVRHLLALAPGQLVETQWLHGNDLPLAAGQVQLAWSEFEVVETRMAVRITHLA
jgi:flagellar motor switch protein FliN